MNADIAELGIDQRTMAHIIDVGTKAGLDNQQALRALVLAGSSVFGCILSSMQEGGTDPVVDIQVRGSSDSSSSVDARTTFKMSDLT